ncbi:MAG: molybdopterin converting factor small subunit [Candidatus Azotimanducaceae bacterium]|jgi:molybdopterin synthase sulfur carrier subunit
MEVSLSGSVRDAVDGLASIEIEAKTIRELLTRLIDRYPKLENHLEEGIAVAIDGTIYRDSWETPIPEGSEVFLLPRIVGG